MKFPLKEGEFRLPSPEGLFGSVRKYDIHTGIDLYAEPGTKVYAVESGSVVSVVDFTGIAAESPWWLDTKAVMIEGSSGVFLYGEIETELKPGDFVFEGNVVGKVLRVLKRDKDKPTSMLHLELYKSGTKEPVWWNLNERQPDNLLDPSDLIFMKEGSE